MTAPPIQPSEWWALVDHFNVPWYIETSEDECRRRMAHWGADAEDQAGPSVASS